MSFSSPQQSASAEAARFGYQTASQLANITMPEISSTLNSAFKDLQSAGTSGIPQSVRDRFDPIISQTNQDYAAAGQGQSAYITQAAKQSGNVMNPNAVSDSILGAGQRLEQSRRGAQQNIAYEEAQAGLTRYNELLNVMGLGAGEALQMGGGMTGLGAQAIGMLNPQSMGGSIMGGATTGASIGSSVAPGWGTLIGGALGGLGGWAGYGG